MGIEQWLEILKGYGETDSFQEYLQSSLMFQYSNISECHVPASTHDTDNNLSSETNLPIDASTECFSCHQG